MVGRGRNNVCGEDMRAYECGAFSTDCRRVQNNCRFYWIFGCTSSLTIQYSGVGGLLANHNFYYSQPDIVNSRYFSAGRQICKRVLVNSESNFILESILCWAQCIVVWYSSNAFLALPHHKCPPTCHVAATTNHTSVGNSSGQRPFKVLHLCAQVGNRWILLRAQRCLVSAHRLLIMCWAPHYRRAFSSAHIRQREKRVWEAYSKISVVLWAGLYCVK